MSFRINTNIAAMNAHANSLITDRELTSSLGRLSSGLRIQTAADDASGLVIADSLKSQANSLGQAIANGNDAIGIVQTADKAMDEQIKILDTIKTKAIQAAQDGQNADSRRALQNDISRLLEELDMIATTTSFNGQQLLNGNFSNKNFQIGAYSNETAKVSIGATNSNTIGHTRFETTSNAVISVISQISGITVKLSGVDGYPNGYVFQKIDGATFKADGYKAVAEMMNGVSDKTGVRAEVNNIQIMSGTVSAGTIKDLRINGVMIGNITVKTNDSDAALIGAINAKKDETTLPLVDSFYNIEKNQTHNLISQSKAKSVNYPFALFYAKYSLKISSIIFSCSLAAAISAFVLRASSRSFFAANAFSFFFVSLSSSKYAFRYASISSGDNSSFSSFAFR